jgi:hypothetical protein
LPARIENINRKCDALPCSHRVKTPAPQISDTAANQGMEALDGGMSAALNFESPDGWKTGFTPEVTMAGPDREERIRERAHALWIEEGRPEGSEERHWLQAAAEIDAQDAPKAPAKKPAAKKAAAPAAKKAPAEKKAPAAKKATAKAK